MTDTVDHVTVKHNSATFDQVDLRAGIASALDEFQRIGIPSTRQGRAGAGGGFLLTVVAGAAAIMYVRHRARERAKPLAWLAFKTGATHALPGARRIAPFGGAGGSLLLLSLLVARARRARERSAGLAQITV